ncbi:MAG: phenylacetate--CoA ligase [Thermodesulfovibrionales bacterium]|nr:phenylacetate--CoA ligase [Thermodesulfovibrionales bacterium]
MYWNEEIETIDRSNLKKLQLKRLQGTVRILYEKVPFYQNKFKELGITPEDIKSLDDVRKLPFTTREDLRDNYPYGLLAVSRDKIVRLHTSSGTTGKPKAIFFSKNDINQSAELIARCLIMTGVTKDDVLQNMMTYGLFTGALVMHYGAEKVGILVIPAGPGNTERQIALMQDFGSTCLHLTPSYALYLSEVMESKGIKPKRDLSLKRAYLGAEPYSEETRKKLESMFEIDIYNSYGLSEMNGPGVAFECICKNGMHIWEDNFLVEILDPSSDEPVKEGQEGELVLTTLCREGMPLLRYRTKDITKVISGDCPCGRTHRRISRILGRVDDMFIVRGVNIFPQQIERVLMSIKGVAQNYQILLESYDKLSVKVEIEQDFFDGSIEHLLNLKTKITEKLKSEILVTPKVELVEPGTLPISEGKLNRVIDKRTL